MAYMGTMGDWASDDAAWNAALNELPTDEQNLWLIWSRANPSIPISTKLAQVLSGVLPGEVATPQGMLDTATLAIHNVTTAITAGAADITADVGALKTAAAPVVTAAKQVIGTIVKVAPEQAPAAAVANDTIDGYLKSVGLDGISLPVIIAVGVGLTALSYSASRKK